MTRPETYEDVYGPVTVEVPDVVTVWDVLGNNPDGLYDLFLQRGFRVPGGRVVWENVRLPVRDLDESGDDVVILQRLVPGLNGGIWTTERRVTIDTVVTLEPK